MRKPLSSSQHQHFEHLSLENSLPEEGLEKNPEKLRLGREGSMAGNTEIVAHLLGKSDPFAGSLLLGSPWLSHAQCGAALILRTIILRAEVIMPSEGLTLTKRRIAPPAVSVLSR